MNWLKDCGVVIPCLNEAAGIDRLVRDVKRIVPRVVVVDDGSTDATEVNAAGAGAVVLRHERTLGKGAALGTGLSWLCGQKMSWAIMMDGDGQHVASDIPKFWARAEATGAALVVGNRMEDRRTMPWIRRVVNGWMSRRLSGLLGRPLADTQCGFRLVNLTIWNTLALEATHFEIESEMLLSFIAGGHGVEFVPIQVVYANESSKIRPLRDTARWFCWWWRAKRRAGQVFDGANRAKDHLWTRDR